MAGSEPFRFIVTDIFSPRNGGVLAIGRVDSGSARLGEVVELVYLGRSIPVTIAEFVMLCNKSRFVKIGSGDHAGIRLTGVAADEIGAGAVIVGAR
ncbi:MAG TPA: hypothetical protein VGE07_02105 [Herpetosiphonaceae bacterium]